VNMLLPQQLSLRRERPGLFEQAIAALMAARGQADNRGNKRIFYAAFQMNLIVGCSHATEAFA
jgi:hypothetical protein